MTTYRTQDECCAPVVTGLGGKRPEEPCEHGQVFLTEKELAKRSAGVGVASGGGSEGFRLSGSRAPATPISKGGADPSTPRKLHRRSTLKRGRGFAASPEQRAKVKDLPCVNCGRDRFEVTITAMHVYPRRFAACDCADGVVSGCVGCHGLYDDQLDTGKLDLLPLLLERIDPVELALSGVGHIELLLADEALADRTKEETDYTKGEVD